MNLLEKLPANHVIACESTTAAMIASIAVSNVVVVNGHVDGNGFANEKLASIWFNVVTSGFVVTCGGYEPPGGYE